MGGLFICILYLEGTISYRNNPLILRRDSQVTPNQSSTIPTVDAVQTDF